MPAFAAAGVLGVVVFAGISRGATSTSTATPGANSDSSSSLGDNPGAVDGSALTVPASTLPPVVVNTDPAVPKTQLSRTLKSGAHSTQVKVVQQRL
jgi:hypothetical protein